MKIFDIKGEVVFESDLNHSLSNVNVSHLPSGAYFIYVFEGKTNIPQTDLATGDSIITDDANIQLQANSKSSIVCFMINKDATYTKNGMFSGMRR
jgi:hypothetical protein